MIRNIWLVAHREYMAYITAWGFWLGMILTPIGLLAGAILPQFIASSQPVRYYAVVDQAGDDFALTLEKRLESWRAGEALIELETRMANETPELQRQARRKFAEARAEGGSPEVALEAAGAPDDLKVPEKKFHEVRAPSHRIEEIERILRAKVQFDGPAGNHPLFAVFMINRDQLGDIESVDYLSDDVVNSELRGAADGALGQLSRDALLAQYGLDDLDIRKAQAKKPDIINRRVGERPQNIPASGGEGETGESLDNENASTTRSEVSLKDRAPFIAASISALALWMLVFSVINYLISGTIEERSNKIFDSLLTSVKVRDLLAGKLLGVFMLSATLICTWATMALYAGLKMRETMGPAVMEFISAAVSIDLIAPALIGFLMGYLMFGAIFLALGSLCDTIQEAQTLLSPLIIFLMIPLVMIIMAIANPQSPMVATLSWFPFFTPFMMILRAPLEPPLWETLGQFGLMLTCTLVILNLSARIYRAGAVHGAGMSEAQSWFLGLFKKA